MADANPPPKLKTLRSLLLAIAALWFLVAAFMRLQDDSIAELVGIIQRLAFGFAIVAVALIDWQRFRWWWPLVALLAVALVWMATGHPLFFLFGGM
jgi:hypothetical protein